MVVFHQHGGELHLGKSEVAGDDLYALDAEHFQSIVDWVVEVSG